MAQPRASSLAERLVAVWYAPKKSALAWALAPLALIFRGVVASRRALYRIGVLRARFLRVPVIVVGNVSVGGAGKTPLSIALAQALAARGRRPGIVSRGYRGANVRARAVVSGDDPRIVGDESLLYANAGLTVWIGHDRAAAAQAMIDAHPSVDVVIADDGLQHYALGRTMEIVVVDAARAFGNGFMLPAGPLREPPNRLNEADAIVRLVTRDAAHPAQGGHSTRMWLETLPWRNVAEPSRSWDSRPYFSREHVHAVAGIAHPDRFFASVRALGIDAQCHPFPDHHFFVREDLDFPDARAILMTEKDAVKCVRFADERFWYLPVRARLDPALVDLAIEKIHGYQAP